VVGSKTQSTPCGLGYSIKVKPYNVNKSCKIISLVATKALSNYL